MNANFISLSKQPGLWKSWESFAILGFNSSFFHSLVGAASSPMTRLMAMETSLDWYGYVADAGGFNRSKGGFYMKTTPAFAGVKAHGGEALHIWYRKKNLTVETLKKKHSNNHMVYRCAHHLRWAQTSPSRPHLLWKVWGAKSGENSVWHSVA